MNPNELVLTDSLVWFCEAQVGYADPGTGIEYGKEYHEEYVKRSRNENSERLMQARYDLVDRYHEGELVDVGAGACAFVDYRNGKGQKTLGYDVNPVTVFELQERGIYFDLPTRRCKAACFFDVLEHFKDPAEPLRKVQDLCFISIPIFVGPLHVMRSHHLKPGEHIWYFTHEGLIRFMDQEGFKLLEANTMESDICRKDIGSYVFRRKE